MRYYLTYEGKYFVLFILEDILISNKRHKNWIIYLTVQNTYYLLSAKVFQKDSKLLQNLFKEINLQIHGIEWKCKPGVDSVPSFIRF